MTGIHIVQVGHLLRWAILAAAIAPAGYYILAIFAARRFFTARHAAPADFSPAVSILKPVKGLDREAYENYASFCRQDYPEFEILFNVASGDDPAIPVIERVMRDFPRRKMRLFFGAEPLGTCNKVNKMARMVREAAHDLLVISDSDIRVGPEYLRAVTAPFADPKVGLVTCLYRGLTDGSLASELEALGNSSDFDAGVLCAWALGGLSFALGATMATTKQRLKEIGGFDALVNYFTDDYELGRRIHHLGYRVALADYPVMTVFPKQSMAECFRHQLRWNLALRHARRGGHASLILTHGLPWALLAALVAPTAGIATVYIGGYLFFRFLMAWTVGVWGLKDPLLRRKMWLLPARDAFAFVVWVISFFKRRIEWRGSEYYIRDNQLIPVGPR